MNTTKNISMGGYAFIVEEDAYFRLKAYTEAVQNNLSGAPGADEMMSDIEARIAEIFRENMRGREVVVNDDVTKVIDRMGEPEVYVQDDAENKSRKKSALSDEQLTDKRIHRDPDNKIIGGVCGGLGAYFNVDPVWFRLGFALTFVFYGSGLLLYIILWVVMPEAKTRTQKLQMRGQRPDLKNIEKSIRSELSGVGDNINKMANEKKIKDGANRVSEVVGDIFTQIFYVIGKIFQLVLKFLAAVVSVLSLAFLVFLVSMLISGGDSIHITGDEVNVKDNFGVLAHSFNSAIERDLFCFFLFIFLSVPAIALLANAIRFLANIKTKTSKWVGLSSVGVWLVATSGLMYLGVKLGMEFSNHAIGKTEQIISVPEGQTLRLRMGDRPENIEGFMMSDISLDIREASDSLYTLRIIKESAGRTQLEAERRQESILYQPLITDSVVIFPELFVLPKGESVRAQSITLELLVPRNGKIFIEPRMQQFIHGIENVQNEHGSEMTGKYWIMTDVGLSCKGCAIPAPDTLGDLEMLPAVAPVPLNVPINN